MQNQETMSPGSEEQTETSKGPKRLPLVVYPDPLLSRPTKRVSNFDEELLELVENMQLTLIKDRGVGLAAPQVGSDKSVLVWLLEDAHSAGIMINPEIVSKSEETNKEWEGCLSFPGVSVLVERANEVEVNYQDITGGPVNKTFKDLYARVIQHEIEHLKGTTFVRYLSVLKRDVVIRKMKKLKRRRERNAVQGARI